MTPETIRERDLGYAPGAVFFEQDGAVMFRFVIDPGSQIGPRVATARDREDHAAAFDAFQAGIAPVRSGRCNGVSLSLVEPEGAAAPVPVQPRGRRGKAAL